MTPGPVTAQRRGAGGGDVGGTNLSPIVMVRVNQQRAQWSEKYTSTVR